MEGDDCCLDTGDDLTGAGLAWLERELFESL